FLATAKHDNEEDRTDTGPIDSQESRIGRLPVEIFPPDLSRVLDVPPSTGCCHFKNLFRGSLERLDVNLIGPQRYSRSRVIMLRVNVRHDARSSASRHPSKLAERLG